MIGRPYARDEFCPVCDGVFPHDDARCDGCNRTRKQARDEAERQVQLEEARNTAEVDYYYVRGITPPDY